MWIRDESDIHRRCHQSKISTSKSTNELYSDECCSDEHNRAIKHITEQNNVYGMLGNMCELIY